jgi:hypothetical protein
MNRLSKFIAVALTLTVSLNVWAREDESARRRNTTTGSQNNSGRISSGCQRSSSRVFLDINNVRAMLLNGGDMWWDLSNPQYEVPKQDDVTQTKRHSLFAGSIWIGGQSPNGQLLVAANTYRGGVYMFWPGPVDANIRDVTQAECLAFNRHWKVNKSEVEEFFADFIDGFIADENDIPDVIKFWPGKNNPFLPQDPNFSGINLNRDLAPFLDFDGNPNQYNPLNGDRPDVRGDQMIWWILNDVGDVKQPATQPIGMEIRVEAFGFQSADDRNDMTFYRNRLYNRGLEIMLNTHMGQWADPDLGQAGDDFVGCDVPRGLGVCYNGDGFDDGVVGYGTNLPFVGIDFFIGPIADQGDLVDNNKDGRVDETDPVDLGCSGEIRFGEPIIMSNFLYYNIGGDPVNGDVNTVSDYYNYLRNRWKTGNRVTYDFIAGRTTWDPLLYPSSAVLCETNFIFPGFADPNSEQQYHSDAEFFWSCGGSVQDPGGPFNYPSPNTFLWTERTANNAPGDRRFLQSAGPFTLEPGAKNEVTTAVVWTQGNIATLLAASDKAQKLFDRCFDNLEGPNSPDMLITELDRELILSFIPDEFFSETGVRQNTLTYEEVDKSLSSVDGDIAYRFQGYKIYQVIDNTVTFAEFNDSNKARLVGQCDIQDGVGEIVNLLPASWDADLLVPTLMVQGADKGIFNSLRVINDQFSTLSDRRLVNYKTYYYSVVAYGYVANSKSTEKYILGSKNTRIYTAIPSKRIGTVLNSKAGDPVQIVRLQGVGNDGNEVEITKTSRDSLINQFKVSHLEYAKGPFSVKVFDPLRVRDAKLKLSLSSRLEYRISSTLDTIRVGDTLVCSGSFTLPASLTLRVSASVRQIPGIAVVEKIVVPQKVDVNTGFTVSVLQVKMLNDHVGGTFKRLDDILQNGGFVRTTEANLSFLKRGGTDTASVTTFELSDYFQIESVSGPDIGIVNNSTPVSRGTDQLIPELGIQISLRRVLNPTEEAAQDVLNSGLLRATLEFADSTKRWIATLVDTTFAFRDLAIADNDFFVQQQDPTQIIRRQMLNGSIIPYPFAEAINRSPVNNPNVSIVDQFAASYAEGSQPNFRLRMSQVPKIGNIDIVLTSDQSKWTRAAVLQHQFRRNEGPGSLQLVNQNRHRLLKSNKVSLNRDLEVDSTIFSPFNPALRSRGMSWFPGYAIDLDKGVRLNIAFAEDRNRDAVTGNDLKWDLSDKRDGNNNFVYIFNTPYDGGINIERELDSMAPTNVGSVNQTNQFNYYINAINYACLFRSGDIGVQPLETDVTIKIRVTKTLASAESGKAGVYLFETNGKTPIFNVESLLKEQLDIIRVAPNPYYSYSQYEPNQVDNRVRMLNLPNRVSINIFTLNGTLVRRFEKDDSATFIDWDLRNQEGIPVAGGVYIMHFNVPGIGEKTIKWFGVTRPLDLDTF